MAGLDLGGGRPPEDDGTAQFAEAIAKLEAQDRLAAEAAERRKRAARELKDLYGDFAGAIDKAAKRNKDLMNSMRDGTFARQARDMAELNRQYEKMRREAELTARYGGRVGGFLARHEGALGAAGRAGGFAAGATLATGGGLVRQGFSGTVEGEQFSREFKILSREFASAFKPLIDVATRGVRSLRKFMEGLDGTGQNVVMAGGLALTGLTAARALGGGGLLAGGARALLTGGSSLAATAAVSGVANAGIAGANKNGVSARGAGKAGFWALLASTAIAAVDAPSERPGERPAGYYDRMRRQGDNKAEASMATLGRAVAKTLGLTSGAKTEAQERAEAAVANGRREVSVAGGGWDSAGSGYERLNEAISLVEPESTKAASDNDAGELAVAAVELKKAAAMFFSMGERRDSPPLRRPSE